METTKKEPRSTKDQSTSAMGTTEGARRATGIVPMAGASAHLVSSAPDPEVSRKKAAAQIYGQIQASHPSRSRCMHPARANGCPVAP